MFDVLMRSAPERLESLRARGLTPNDARALFTLAPGAGTPMGALARAWNCDPSTATWLVDRLARAGLIERVPSAADRRVKLIRLTPLGSATTKKLLKEYYRPPPEMNGLSARELDELLTLLDRLTGAAEPPDQ